ncbi:hypothetical protein AB0A74_07155 [Saccharothrix sp. NPDC042600]|uniref:hypothetical protein n=1 Tax=Saccharothrix TaxID=2071 RepID=UPI0033FA69AF|nr:hypothetical protein GCM10017745_30460 [Saccharothrix mutabilis subsp. capreolus]
MDARALLAWLREAAAFSALPLLDSTGYANGLHLHRFSSTGQIEVVQAWHQNHAALARLPNALDLHTALMRSEPESGLVAPLDEVVALLRRTEAGSKRGVGDGL